MDTDKQDDYCHDHDGWGSDTKPCKVCGAVSLKRTMSEIPKGLTFAQALVWGAEQINLAVSKHVH